MLSYLRVLRIYYLWMYKNNIYFQIFTNASSATGPLEMYRWFSGSHILSIGSHSQECGPFLSPSPPSLVCPGLELHLH